MDLVLVYRTVILDIIIMLFLLCYGIYCKTYDEHSRKFIPFATVCLFYSVFGLITEITVNSTTIPPKVNDICHIFYFAFGLLFSFIYLKYVLELVVSQKTLNKLLILAGALSLICLFIMIFSEIIYIDGPGTRYSQGTGPTVCFALGFLFILASDLIIIIKRNKIEKAIWYALLPITMVAVILLTIQIIYPIFLFSESAIVLICLGAFFAIEDPVGKFQQSAKLYHDYAYVDGMTGLFNRRSYDEKIYKNNNVPSEDKYIYVTIDANGLKVINDTKGHTAGDEMLAGVAECMKASLGKYGELFRIGGDEFVAILYIDSSEMKKVALEFENAIDNWSGKQNDKISVSYGWVDKNEMPAATTNELADVAEQRMYKAKTEYYRTQGIDRRGQQDAHKALCELYAKILGINATDDTYRIINMDANEQTKEKGFADKISEWLSSFGNSGQVHPDDLSEYLRLTDIDYIRQYFKDGNESLIIFYRRKFEDGFKKVMLEIVPANDYSDDNQSLFLYVKNIEK